MNGYVNNDDNEMLLVTWRRKAITVKTIMISFKNTTITITRIPLLKIVTWYRDEKEQYKLLRKMVIMAIMGMVLSIIKITIKIQSFTI